MNLKTLRKLIQILQQPFQLKYVNSLKCFLLIGYCRLRLTSKCIDNNIIWDAIKDNVKRQAKYNVYKVF